ncbi:Hypothetical predicted protein [Mytilus galloprovincialis]|uniref:Paired domain-containing protein n=1 Tax=Mytilus galloprovincialis TaxID=29158 RepID=A0A8B6DKP7_MYTGA|nr:Hypothetical predicted protein [Mytilus galloprovincialis]
MIKQNSFGRYYEVGKATNVVTRKTILDMYLSGNHTCAFISKHCAVSHNTVRNVIDKYQLDGSVSPVKYQYGATRLKSSEDIVQAFRYYKFRKPSIYGKEIQNGPSNGFHLVDFFSDALQELDRFGNYCLRPGDTVVMDNCGFHHGRFAENTLRFILGHRHIDLLYQPPYHPDLNTCEVCFKVMKDYLRKHTTYARELTEMAICDGLGQVSASKSSSIFRGCGYL